MSRNTLYDKVWDLHKVADLPDGKVQLYVGRHLMHEITSPAAFAMLKKQGLKVAHPEQTFATVDHIIPTESAARKRPFANHDDEMMISALEENVKTENIRYFAPNSGSNGVCHVTFPEQGLVWPGQVVVCGDSHTCTYGAFGAIAFGIGTTDVANVLATQTIVLDSKLKVRRIDYGGTLGKGVTAKDVALYTIMELGIKGGFGFAYEFGGKVIDEFNMEQRMTLCNMAVEGGARLGYVNPDNKTVEYLKKSPHAPKSDFNQAAVFWKSIASEKDAYYDDRIRIDVSQISPIITWGTNPEQAIFADTVVPPLQGVSGAKFADYQDALLYMGLKGGEYLTNIPVDVVFIGSCTNGRLSDLWQAAQILEGRHVAVRTLVVPGSDKVKKDAEDLGLDSIFKDAGAEWRFPGCSMCLAMNPDKLTGYQRSASTSNRNFMGRQGSETGRTHIMSPYTAAATAIEGKFADPRKYL